MTDEIYLGITRLHATYADNASRRDWDAMRDIVTLDATFTFDLGAGRPLELTGPQELADFGRNATAAFDFYSYQPLNAVILTAEPTTATGRFYALEIATLRDTGRWIEFYGLYEDEYVLDDRRWKFAARTFRTRAHRSRDA